MCDNNTFEYSYSASQQEDIIKIRNKYLPPAEDAEKNKLEKLKKLDDSVYKKGTAYSIAVGILGTLILGVGMCCCLVWGQHVFVLGIFVGFLGIACIIAAYPLYLYIIKKERERIAPEILQLTEELLK